MYLHVHPNRDQSARSVRSKDDSRYSNEVEYDDEEYEDDEDDDAIQWSPSPVKHPV